MRIDDELDLHGFTLSSARWELQHRWTDRWYRMARVRIIHGTGEVLWHEVRRWCEERGIPWTVEAHNPGVTILHPTRRELPTAPPLHRPLAPPLKRAGLPVPRARVRSARPRLADAKPPPPAPAPADEHLLEEEMKRLEAEDPTALRKRKFRG